jgi:hypothetical protein
MLFVDGGNNKVGIGTNAPDKKLEVAGDIKLANSGKLYLWADHDLNYLDYSTWRSSVSAGMSIMQTAASHLALGTSNTERMRIDSSGRLLLNATTTAFGDKLYVNGDAYVTGGWRIGTGATYTGKIYNSSGIMSIETDSNRDIQFGDSGTPAIMYIDTSTENVGIGTTTPAAKLQVEALGIDTTTTSTTATTQVAIDSMVAATFRSARYTIQVTNSTDNTYHLTEMLLIHNGTTPSISEFGTIFTGSAAEAAFTADISSGNVRILATPASTDAMAFKVIRHSITV